MPRVQMTRMAKIALYTLPFYLVAMLGLILYKFIRMLSSGDPLP
ncbi:MAG: hypothetical protein NT049_04665 [Planctomycetota bacterium]|nr:hypothetical protein [Planctomycetota bacterium]